MDHPEEDQLEYILKRVNAMATSEFARVAVGAGVVEKTMYNLRKPGVDPHYSTVKKLYKFLKANKTKARAKAPK